ncbi:MAG: tRNA pseudouridine(38-40) synthase TruA [Mediterranea sp.]|jgi:tRNA pseudouridine38-40 synthase|nr:tRNA pseudouridine(38-40) synthase TruA [Mediterranea sp.]
MQRYFIYLGYDGANYHGWQMQPNGISLQECVMEALSTFLRKETQIVGAGRTDAGVHATLMVAHFDYEGEPIDTALVIEKLNRMLPEDICIYRIRKVKADAHARFDAITRMYNYYVATRKTPFNHRYLYYTRSQPDIELMNKAAKTLFDYSDFTSFSKLHSNAKTNNCKIIHAEWVQQDDATQVFSIRADRFLRNMVRAIVGTILEVGYKKITVDEFRQVIEQKDRKKAGTSAPAQALFLVDITYPEELFEDDRLFSL